MHDKHGQIVVAYKNLVKAMADFSMERTLGTGILYMHITCIPIPDTHIDMVWPDQYGCSLPATVLISFYMPVYIRKFSLFCWVNYQCSVHTHVLLTGMSNRAGGGGNATVTRGLCVGYMYEMIEDIKTYKLEVKASKSDKRLRSYGHSKFACF